MGEDTSRSEDGEKLGRVGDAALEELLKRLVDPEEAKKLPGTGLLTIANAYVKVREKQIERDLGKTDGPPQDEVDVILDSPLPPARKREQLINALARLDERRKRLMALLEGDLE